MPLASPALLNSGLVLNLGSDRTPAAVPLDRETLAREEDLERFESDRVALESEVGEQLTFSKPPDAQEFQMSARNSIDTRDPATVDAQLDWLCRVGDRFVTAVRARF
jgi:hypothetical protein